MSDVGKPLRSKVCPEFRGHLSLNEFVHLGHSFRAAVALIDCCGFIQKPRRQSTLQWNLGKHHQPVFNSQLSVSTSYAMGSNSAEASSEIWVNEETLPTASEKLLKKSAQAPFVPIGT